MLNAVFSACMGLMLMASTALGAIDPRDLQVEQMLSSFMHQEGLATLAGIKPMSLIRVENPSEVVQQLDQARALGVIQNQNLGWFFEPARVRTLPVDFNGVPRGTVTTGFLILYNRDALTRLLQDASVQAFFNSNGIIGVIDVASAQEALLGRYSISHGEAYEPSLLLGVLLGFPKEDALAFAKAQTQIREYHGRIMDSRFGVTIYSDREVVGWSEGFYLGGFALFSDQNLNLVEQMQSDARLAVERYKEASQRGLRPSQIINLWSSLPVPRSIHCDLLLKSGSAIE